MLLLVKWEAETNVLEPLPHLADPAGISPAAGHMLGLNLQAANTVSGVVVHGKYLHAAHFPSD